MKLNLVRPIIFFDLETTGTNIGNDRIVEIAYLKVLPDGTEKSKCIRVNPEMDIPKASTDIHGISNEDVKDAPTFKQIAAQIAVEFEGCDIAGFNSTRFDIPLLAEEFIRAEVDVDLKKKNFIDVQVIFHKMEQRTLSAAYKFYCNKDLENAHSAEADTRATYEVLLAQLERYEGKIYKDPTGAQQTPIVNNIETLSKFTSFTNNVDFAGRIIYDEKNQEVFNFGKYKGVSVTKVLAEDAGYYSWMMQGDFPAYTKKVLTALKLKNFNNK